MPLRRFAAAIFILLAFLSAVLSGCGGGNKSDGKTGVPTSISITPNPVSLNFGAVSPITAVVLDGNGNPVVSSTIAFTSPSSSASLSTATVSNGTWLTIVCAGSWNSNQTVCNPGTTTGKVDLVATSGSLTATASIYVHPKVDRIVLAPTAIDCLSQKTTQQFTATVFSGSTNITSSVGPLTWKATSADVVNVDSSGVATAGQPGRASVFAGISGVNSLPAAFVTCPVRSIQIHLQDSTATSFTIDASTNQQLAADVLDSNGAPITANLSWVSARPRSATVSSSGLVAGLGGFSGINAMCLPPSCNQGDVPQFSNIVLGQVNGAPSTTVYAAGTTTTSVIPIDTSTNTAGTAITLPNAPNSFLVSPDGATGFFGSSQALMVLDFTTATVSSITDFPGKVLAVSITGRVLVAGSNVVSIVNSDNTAENLGITGATAASFTPDGRAYILAGSTVFVYDRGTLRSFPLSSPGNDVESLASGALGFTGQSNSVVSANAACNDSLFGSVATTGAATLLGALPDGSGMLAVNSPRISLIKPPANLSGCPPTGTLSLSSKDFGQGAFTPRQVIVLPSGAKAYITNDQAQLLAYDVTAPSGGATSTIPLANGASAFTGGSTSNAATVYVGGSDNNVHRIDVATGIDAQQISVSFTPDLVAVKP